MPIVTIRIALRACSGEKQGSRQKTLTAVCVHVEHVRHVFQRRARGQISFHSDGEWNGIWVYVTGLKVMLDMLDMHGRGRAGQALTHTLRWASKLRPGKSASSFECGPGSVEKDYLTLKHASGSRYSSPCARSHRVRLCGSSVGSPCVRFPKSQRDLELSSHNVALRCRSQACWACSIVL